MPDPVDEIILRILAVRDCDSTRNLCGDIRIVAVLRGNAYAAELGDVVLFSVTRYVEYDKWLKAGAKPMEKP